jgi:uncharacterized protein (TIGR02145 family)
MKIDYINLTLNFFDRRGIMRFFTKQGRALLLAIVAAVGAVCIWGCGGDDNPGGNSWNNSGSSGAATPGPSVNHDGRPYESIIVGGKTYRIAVIGGKTWMAENLNFQTSSGSWCYGEGGHVYDSENDGYVTITSGEIQANCNKYGRLYDWNTAKTACPNGWHLPSRAEWDDLLVAAGDNHNAGATLRSTTGWNDYNGSSSNGTDNFGFSALPGGVRDSDGSFYNAGNRGFWWTATEHGSDNAYAYSRGIFYELDHVLGDYDSKIIAFSVRCVGD